MIIGKNILLRLPPIKAYHSFRPCAGTRLFSSSDCAPAQRLRQVLDEYRRQNYSRETPGRFKKEIVKSVPSDNYGNIPIDGLNQILVNIGRGDQVLSEEELTQLVSEANPSDTNTSSRRFIPASAFMQLV